PTTWGSRGMTTSTEKDGLTRCAPCSRATRGRFRARLDYRRRPGGEIGRRMGLKIPWGAIPVQVRILPRACTGLTGCDQRPVASYDFTTVVPESTCTVSSHVRYPARTRIVCRPAPTR